MSNRDDFDFYCEVALQPGAPIEKVYENEQILAFHHTKPYWERHIVVIPKEHILDLRQLTPTLLTELMATIQNITNTLSEEDLAKGVQVLTNLGSKQDTPHVHFHIGIGQKIK